MRNQVRQDVPASRYGFTLVEMLVVIALLGLIMSLVGPRVMQQFANAKAHTASLQLADLSAGLDLFFLDVGRYPSSDEGLRALIQPPVTVAGWNGPYMKKVSIPEDPWGRSYQYEAPGQHGSYDLMSLGADGRAGGTGNDADIVSWE